MYSRICVCVKKIYLKNDTDSCYLNYDDEESYVKGDDGISYLKAHDALFKGSGCYILSKQSQ